MTCNCKEDIEKRLTDLYVEKLPKSKDVNAELMGYGMYLTDNTIEMKPHMSVEVRHTVTSKAGSEKRKTEKVNMKFSFCPFCGTSLAQRAKAQEGQANG